MDWIMLTSAFITLIGLTAGGLFLFQTILGQWENRGPIKEIIYQVGRSPVVRDVMFCALMLSPLYRSLTEKPLTTSQVLAVDGLLVLFIITFIFLCRVRPHGGRARYITACVAAAITFQYYLYLPIHSVLASFLIGAVFFGAFAGAWLEIFRPRQQRKSQA